MRALTRASQEQVDYFRLQDVLTPWPRLTRGLALISMELCPTSIAATDSETNGAKIIIGKNTDWYPRSLRDILGSRTLKPRYDATPCLTSNSLPFAINNRYHIIRLNTMAVCAARGLSCRDNTLDRAARNIPCQCSHMLVAARVFQSVDIMSLERPEIDWIV